MKKPLVSVIVPIYNAEAFLNRCVDSILSQSLQEIEVILVDDGSTDSSESICKKYAQTDDRVKFIHQDNSGVAMARKAGIEAAHGVFSIHTDPDDRIEPTMLEEMYTKAVESNADMVICDFMVDFSDRSYRADQQINEKESIHCLEQMMYGKIHGSLCNKLIRTELYHNHSVQFFHGINYCEDFLACAQMFIHGIKVEYIPKAFYHYDQVVNDNSATRQYSKNTLDTQFRFFKKLREILGHNPPKALSHTISVIAFDCYYNKILTPDEFEKTFNKYKKDFIKSRLKYKRRIALYLAASGKMKYARILCK